MCSQILNSSTIRAVLGLKSLTLRQERRLRVFENRVLRKIFRSNWGEVTGEWKKLNHEALNDGYP